MTLSPSPARVVATLLACAGALAAGDAVPETDIDVTRSYSYDEIAEGRDIHEGIYGSHGDGEFDEWRIHLGVSPGLDRVQIKSNINGNPYPGPAFVETDRVVNDPALPPQIGLVWVLGDYERRDGGWFYTLGLEYTRRDYQILYGIGADSVPLRLNAVAAHLGMGHAWYLHPRLRVEVEPFAAVGMMWNELDLIDLSIPAPEKVWNGGPLIEGGIRSAVVWHPARTQSWHLGAALDWRTGYAQTIYNAEDATLGNIRGEVRLWWYGFGGSLFYGQKF